MSDEKERLHLIRFEARNFKKIRAGVWDITPGLNRLTSDGKNKQGKTAVLHGIRCLFEGAGASPPDPIHEDAEPDDESFVRGCISNGWTIQRKFTEKNPKGYLTVTGPDGLEGKQGSIDPWLGNGHFDPLGFFQLSSEEQARALLALSSVEDLEGKLEALERIEDEFYEQRTPFISEKRRLRGVEKPEGERPEPISVKDEMDQLGRLQKKQREATDLVREHREKANQAHRSLADAKEEEEECRSEVARLRAELKEAEAFLEQAEEETEKRRAAVEELENEQIDVPDYSGQIEQVKAKIDRAEEIQEALEPWKEYDRAQEKLPEVEAKVDELTSKIKEAQEERARLISEADFPVEGLDFTPEGEVILNGHPLEQASGRERVELGVTAALAHDPKLRLVLVDEASSIDQEGLEHLARLGEEHELDIILARLGLEGKGELEIVDGWGPVPVEELAPEEDETDE